MSESPSSTTATDSDPQAADTVTTAQQHLADPSSTAAEPTDDLVATSHTLRTATSELQYTAHAGRMVLRDEVVTDGKFEGHQPRAEVFLTAYTLDDADP